MEAGFPIETEWVIISEYGREKTVMTELAAIIRQLDPQTPRSEDMLTAVSEACLNAFEHGNGLNRNLPVTVKMTVEPIRYIFRVTDEGDGFPSSRRAPCEHELESRGWGLIFINSLADRWAFGWNGGKFFIEMEFIR